MFAEVPAYPLVFPIFWGAFAIFALLMVRRLRVFEAGSVFFYSLGMALSVVAARTLDPGGKYSMLLAFTSMIIGRAVLVP